MREAKEKGFGKRWVANMGISARRCSYLASCDIE